MRQSVFEYYNSIAREYRTRGPLVPFTAPSGAMTDAADVYYRRVSAYDRRRRRLLPAPLTASRRFLQVQLE
jgi:hypothetical protein